MFFTCSTAALRSTNYFHISFLCTSPLFEIFVHRPVTPRIPGIFFISSKEKGKQTIVSYPCCWNRITTQCPSLRLNKKSIWSNHRELWRIVMQIPYNSKPQSLTNRTFLSDKWTPSPKTYCFALVTHSNWIRSKFASAFMKASFQSCFLRLLRIKEEEKCVASSE